MNSTPLSHTHHRSAPWLAPALAVLLLGAASCGTTELTEPELDAPRFTAADPTAKALAAELSFEALYADDALLAGVDQVWLKRVQISARGTAHTRVLQTVDNIPVFAGEMIIHLDKNGRFEGVSDGLIRNIVVDTKPRLTPEQAADLAVDSHGGWTLLSATPAVDLQILRHDGQDYLTYRVQLQQLGHKAAKPSMPIVFIDAHDGAEVWGYDNLMHYTLQNTDVETYDMKQKSNYNLANLADSSDAVALEAHDNAGYTVDYYLTTHGRDSFDDAGSVVENYVHYNRNYVNAYWNGSVLTFGDGDGVNSGPLVSLDVVAHEFTHGVTERTASLVYSNESGALNEAMSDIFAAATEAFVDGAVTADTWMVGEDCWLADTALRYMDDPTQDGSSRDHYSTRYTGTSDNGGVHWNSGIANLAFYLLVSGGSHPDPALSVGTVNGIGMDAAAAIFYDALAYRMTANSDFADAAGKTEAACAALGYSTSVCDSVTAAWAEVGVTGSGSGGPGGGTNCTGATVTALDVQGTTVSANELRRYTIDVPADACDLTVTTTGSSGDADLYVKFGSQAEPSDYDCGSFSATSNEQCVIASPSQGTWHVTVHGYRRSPGLDILGTYQEP